MASGSKIQEFLLKFELPLDRNGIDIYIFLTKYLSKFREDFLYLLDHSKEENLYPKEIFHSLIDRQSKIFRLCDVILETINLYLDGKVFKSHGLLYSMLSEMKTEFASCRIGQDKNYYSLSHELFRIRNVECPQDFHSKDLFHISFNEINKVKPYRYSIAGYPCLYLATDKYLCWLECEENPSFYHSKFVNYSKSKILILDFRYRPKEFCRLYDSHFINHKLGKIIATKEQQDFVTSIFVNYIVTLPLLISCSIINGQKDACFHQEYIIPQILLSWVRENSFFDGVAYFSCSPKEEARKVGSYNIVFPTIREVGYQYCRKLLNIFKVSKPNYCNITEYRSAHPDVDSNRIVLFKIDDNECFEEISNPQKKP